MARFLYHPSIVNITINSNRIDAYGLGGSIMLDYTLVKPKYDVEYVYVYHLKY